MHNNKLLWKVPALALCIALVFSGCGRKTPGTNANDISDTQMTSTEDSAPLPLDPVEVPGELLCYPKVDVVNSWESGGLFYYQFEGYIYNNSKEDINDWAVVFEGCEASKMDSIWNAKQLALNNGVLTLTCEDYNSTVYVGQNTGFGFVLSFAQYTAVHEIAESAVLFVNGKEYTLRDPSTDATETASKPTAESGTPLANHGALSVSGTSLVDKNGKPYQLRGISTHGLTWFPQYANKDAFTTLRDEWGANLVRIAMYTDTGDSYGYCSGGDKVAIKSQVDSAVSDATSLGMYVIIDWHILNDGNPNKHIEEAKVFWDETSAQYANYDNVLYEICNEPNGCQWSDVKTYAETIIPIIRANDPDAIIIVGTTTWCQDVDTAATDPITGYDNIIYSVHYYAATHQDFNRTKVKTALDAGLPIFASEFSICDASGNGSISYDSADAWAKLLNDNNISFVSWSLCNKNETSALLKSSCDKTSGWSDGDLSDAGKYIKEMIGE